VAEVFRAIENVEAVRFNEGDDEALNHLTTFVHRRLIGCQANSHITARNNVTDRGLAHLKNHRMLEVLNIPNAAVTDDGLGHLHRLIRLKILTLGHAHVSDQGLGDLADMTVLQSLTLPESMISDASVPKLGRFEQLRVLDLKGSRITDAGAARLHLSLPNCSIGH
jgi:hypothetical protein